MTRKLSGSGGSEKKYNSINQKSKPSSALPAEVWLCAKPAEKSHVSPSHRKRPSALTLEELPDLGSAGPRCSFPSRARTAFMNVRHRGNNAPPAGRGGEAPL